MTRTIFATFLAVVFLFLVSGLASAQDFILRDSNPDVVSLSRNTADNYNVFEDTNNDGIYDAINLNGELVTANIRANDAQGFQYEDDRYIVFYPSGMSGIPTPGTSEILGFIHYFDDNYLSAYLAVVAEQAIADETTNGMGVFFYDSSGMRVGAPTTMFMEKSRLRAIPIYQQWVEMAIDFGIGSNPINSQFFVIAKDLGLQDDILIVMFQLYQ